MDPNIYLEIAKSQSHFRTKSPKKIRNELPKYFKTTSPTCIRASPKQKKSTLELHQTKPCFASKLPAHEIGFGDTPVPNSSYQGVFAMDPIETNSVLGIEETVESTNATPMSNWASSFRMPRPMPCVGKGLPLTPLSEIPTFLDIWHIIGDKNFSPIGEVGRGRGRGRSRGGRGASLNMNGIPRALPLRLSERPNSGFVVEKSEDLQSVIAPEVNMDSIRQQCREALPGWNASRSYSFDSMPAKTTNNNQPQVSVSVPTSRSSSCQRLPQPRKSLSVKSISSVRDEQLPTTENNSQSLSNYSSSSSSNNSIAVSSSNFASPPVSSNCSGSLLSYLSFKNSDSEKETTNDVGSSTNSFDGFFVPNISGSDASEEDNLQHETTIPYSQKCTWDPEYVEHGPHAWTKEQDFPQLSKHSPPKLLAEKPKEVPAAPTLKTAADILRSQSVLQPVELQTDSGTDSSEADLTNFLKCLETRNISKPELLVFGNLPVGVTKEDLKELVNIYGAEIVSCKIKNENNRCTASIKVKNCDGQYVAESLNGTTPFGAKSCNITCKCQD